MKRCLGFFLACILLLGLLPSTVGAQTVFSDVLQEDWFYEEILNCYQMGLVSGDGSGMFYPYELINRAEVISAAARLHSRYKEDAHVFEQTQPWYMSYVEYAIAEKIISASDFDADYERPASRGEVAYIYANALPYTEFKNKNTAIVSVPDVADTDEYYNQIIMLYRAGVLTGKDETGRFAPTVQINRAEAAAILNRVADPTQRISASPSSQGNESTTKQTLSAVEIAAQCSPAVFYIEVYNARGQAYASGSGFFITTSGVAVTNHHVIEDAYSAKIRLIDGREYDVLGICSVDKANDLAIVLVDGDGFSSLEIGDSTNLQAGQTIYCVGSPLGLENTISEGIISHPARVYDGVTYIQISAPISSGSSGGAVIDEVGKVIGVSSAGFEDGQNLNLAIPIALISTMETEELITFAQFQGVSENETQTYPKPQRPSGTDCYENTSIPDYGRFTNRRLRSKVELQESDGYVYCYAYSAIEAQAYMMLLEQSGFVYYSSERMDGGVLTFYVKGEELVGVYLNVLIGEIWIVA